MISLGQTMVSLELRDAFKDGVALRIGTRAFDILQILIQYQGQLVSKEAILQTVWPDTVVEENNLQVHISALRKALANDRDCIRTIPGRGYVLLGGEEQGLQVIDDPLADSAHCAAVVPAACKSNRLPVRVALLGRDALLADLSQGLRRGNGLVTLVGPGGVGKTALAVELGQRLVDNDQAVYFVSLAQVHCGELLLEALTCALGIDGQPAPVLQTLIEHLALNPGLMILDNCEHLIESVASLVEALMGALPTLCILATSREPLRIVGERSQQVPPLDAPVPQACREAILRSASAQLFLSHWRALDSHVVVSGDADLDNFSIELIGEVCRRLDGMPLALEMAAVRACALGLYQLIASLDGSVHLLTASVRTAPARQQTLLALHDWSERQLSQDERMVLRKLARIEGRFTLEHACEALQCSALDRAGVMACVVRLAFKSLLMVSVQGPFRFYRMLSTTRACLLMEGADTPVMNAVKYHLRGQDALQALAGLQAVPAGFDGYHARYQRTLNVGR